MNSISRLAHLGAALALAAALGAAPAHATKVTFRYVPVIGGVSSVAVAGSFNGWDKAANPLADADKDGTWELVLDLPQGKVTYKFVVNGDQWFTDESAAASEDDGFGGKNAVLEIKDKPLVAGAGSNVVKKPASSEPLGLRQVTFKYRPDTKAQSLALAGAFNDWSTTKTPMSDSDGDGNWTVTLLLAPGSYPYKFVVNGTGWTQDRQGQDGEVDDGYGGKNSLRNVDARYPQIAVKVGDGKVFPDGLDHTQGANEVNAMGGGRVEFTARAHQNDVQGVDLVTWTNGAERVTPMRAANEDLAFVYYRALVTLPAGETPYAFRYRDGAKTLWLGPAGFTEAAAGKFTYSPERFPAFETPEWVKNAIIYQIFPDRFRNGNPANDQDFHEWYYEGKHTAPAPGTRINPEVTEYYHVVEDWNDAAALSQCAWTPGGRDWMAFYGGDIAGVREKLDYLKSLGVSAIYFNPIFEAKSTHKYDAADFRKIDPHFGTNEEFIAFVKEAHAKGIRVILDIVYNHCGNSHWAFKDAVEKGKQSPYYDWFDFKRWPLPAGWPNVGSPWKPGDYYACWWGFGDLPDLNYDLSRDDKAEIPVRDVKDAVPNIALVNYLLDATTYWLKDADVDGLRLDVPNEVPYWFWKLFNQRVKSAKPDAYIMGELWGSATDYVRPGVYDAVMNYAYCYFPVERFLCKGEGTARDFDATLAAGRNAYPTQAVETQMNLVSSHDKPRYVTRARGDLKRLRLAALFQMTYVGAPAIYYGDEVALEGGEDPDNRRPFPWTYEQDAKRVETLEWYRRLGALRNAHPSLRTGDFRTLDATGMVYAYQRSDAQETFVVAMNAGAMPGESVIDLAPFGGTVKATDALTGATATWTGKARIALEGTSGKVFKIERAAGAR